MTVRELLALLANEDLDAEVFYADYEQGDTEVSCVTRSIRGAVGVVLS